jgi:hypothetical protein
VTPPRFDEQKLKLLNERVEVDVVTVRPDGTERRTIIWVVVDDGEVFARSYKGDRGHWFQAALDKPDEVALVGDGQTIPVRATLAIDEESVARCSRGLQRKYRRSRSLDAMLVPSVLGTTLRLDPR